MSNVREQALKMAIDYCGILGITNPKKVTDTAKMFEAYLNGDAAPVSAHENPIGAVLGALAGAAGGSEQHQGAPEIPAPSKRLEEMQKVGQIGKEE